VSLVVPVLRAVVRDELADVQPLVLGAVTSVATNADGSGAHNVEANVQLHGSALELQRVPVAAGRIGLSAPPRVGDTAVVAFVGGDLDGPIVLGFLHDDQRHPPKGAGDEVVYEVPDDGSGARRVEVVTASGHTITVKDDQVTITMGGSRIDVKADGDVTVQAAGDLVLKAAGAVNITAGGDVSVDAQRNATVKGAVNATVQATAAATLKGATTSIAGVTSFSPA
jgi:uncharacterized protein involved in type VI secretion and phage assembly